MKTLPFMLMIFVGTTLTGQTLREPAFMRSLVNEIIIETDSYLEKQVYSNNEAPFNYVMTLPSYSSFDLVNMKLKSVYEKHSNIKIAFPWRKLQSKPEVLSISSVVMVDDSVLVLIFYTEIAEKKSILIAGCFNKNSEKIFPK